MAKFFALILEIVTRMRVGELSIIFYYIVYFFLPQSYVEGHTNILGISTYCRLNLTTTRIELLVQGNFLNLIKAELYMTASYSLTWLGTQFYIRINVDLHAINNVRKCFFPYLTKTVLTSDDTCRCKRSKRENESDQKYITVTEK